MVRKKRDGIKYATEFPLVALAIGGDCSSEDISAGRPATRNTIADVIIFDDVKANRQLIDLTRLEEDSANNYSADKTIMPLSSIPIISTTSRKRTYQHYLNI